MTNPFDQGGYQVRLEWGAAGLARLAPADILVLVDVLGPGAAPLAALEAEPTATVSAAALPGGVPTAQLTRAARSPCCGGTYATPRPWRGPAWPSSTPGAGARASR